MSLAMSDHSFQESLVRCIQELIRPSNGPVDPRGTAGVSSLDALQERSNTLDLSRLQQPPSIQEMGPLQVSSMLMPYLQTQHLEIHPESTLEHLLSSPTSTSIMPCTDWIGQGSDLEAYQGGVERCPATGQRVALRNRSVTASSWADIPDMDDILGVSFGPYSTPDELLHGACITSFEELLDSFPPSYMSEQHTPGQLFEELGGEMDFSTTLDVAPLNTIRDQMHKTPAKRASRSRDFDDLVDSEWSPAKHRRTLSDPGSLYCTMPAEQTELEIMASSIFASSISPPRPGRAWPGGLGIEHFLVPDTQEVSDRGFSLEASEAVVPNSGALQSLSEEPAVGSAAEKYPGTGPAGTNVDLGKSQEDFVSKCCCREVDKQTYPIVAEHQARASFTAKEGPEFSRTSEHPRLTGTSKIFRSWQQTEHNADVMRSRLRSQSFPPLKPPCVSGQWKPLDYAGQANLAAPTSLSVLSRPDHFTQHGWETSRATGVANMQVAQGPKAELPCHQGAAMHCSPSRQQLAAAQFRQPIKTRHSSRAAHIKDKRSWTQVNFNTKGLTNSTLLHVVSKNFPMQPQDKIDS